MSVLLRLNLPLLCCSVFYFSRKLAQGSENSLVALVHLSEIPQRKQSSAALPPNRKGLALALRCRSLSASPGLSLPYDPFQRQGFQSCP